jgi:CRP-like cAMP-binding protein
MASLDRFQLDGYVVDALLPDLVGHDRSPSAFLLFLFLWRRTGGAARSTVLSHQMAADGTGLTKRSVQVALRHLVQRGLVTVRRKTKTSAAVVALRCDWRG